MKFRLPPKRKRKKGVRLLWLNALHETLTNGQACVLVSISAVEGSAPRDVGSRMLVCANTVADTIGGGALEKQAIEQARALLSNAATEQLIESHVSILGTDLAQCCGGKVTLNYEYHPACELNVVVFGAGHVAQSIAKLLAGLPCRAHFFDSRKDWLDKLPTNETTGSAIVAKELGENVFTVVEHCPDNAYYLVMTHSHELDMALVESILTRGDSVYCGLIASKSKAAKFKSRLKRKGFTEFELQKLTAPIGAEQAVGNLPMEVAIAAVSEMLSVRNARQSAAQSLNKNKEANANLFTG